MARPKGSPKLGGRQKGTPNKKTNLFAICDEVGLNVFKEMVTLASLAIEPNDRFSKLRELAPYLYAKKKEVLNLDDHTVEELIETAEKKLSDTSEET
jgi:hypothetical protein